VKILKKVIIPRYFEPNRNPITKKPIRANNIITVEIQIEEAT
jgi:hypothetical protein